MMTSPCAKHPHQPLVGVCASCLREKLALCISSLGKSGGGGGEAESANDGAFGSSIIVSKGIGNGSPILRDINKRTLSYYLENIQGVSSDCNVHASHIKSISSDALYQGNSFYASHHYVPNEGSYLKGAKENSSVKGSPTLGDGFSKGGPLSWFSALFSKREEKRKVDSREGSIAPWRECRKESVCEGAYDQYDSRCTHSFSSEAPSWEHLSPWRKLPTRSPSLLSSQSTRPPLKLPPLLSSALSTRYPLTVPSPPLSSQSTRSPLKLHPLRSSPRSPLKLPPLLNSPRSPLKLPSLLSSKPTIACDVNSQPQTVSAQIEEDSRSGHAIPSKKKEIWFRIFLRNKWFVRFKRHFAKRKNQEDAESVRTSSAKESDCSRHSQNHYIVQALHGQNHWFTEKNQCRHSQNHWFMEKNHFQNQRSPMLNRPLRAGREAGQRWGSGSGRDYAGWESYFSNSLNGLQVRHRCHSADSAEMLRFYLTPVRSTCKLRSHYYY